MIKQYKNGYIINLTDAVISQYEVTKKKNRHTLRSDLLKWKPYVVMSVLWKREIAEADALRGGQTRVHEITVGFRLLVSLDIVHTTSFSCLFRFSLQHP